MSDMIEVYLDDLVDAALPVSRGERVQADAARVERLKLKEFCGPELEVLKDELCREAMPILSGMLRSGKLFKECQERFARKGIVLWVHPDDVRQLHRSQEDRDEIVVDTLVKALPVFCRKALVEGGWDPDHRGPRGAACLTTYFISRCIWEFRSAYVRWARARMKTAKLEAELYRDEVLQRLLTASDYLSGVEARRLTDAFRKLVDEQPPATQAVVRMTLEGYRVSEIADKLGVNRSAVSMRLNRFRTFLYQAARERRLWIPAQLHSTALTAAAERGAA
ncbi:putative transcriptional rgulator [Kitasatospora phosalacinea]|uniref:Transcriptional rgulator n=1 Tax=Kitasatospora phosalacinea TaxID=2065 RepID=A0A9W6QHE7_9ACTN|nr:ECF-type sigma factor [Kitasatospora phosalacinea]GLW74517.1 putative transcriptional rgulator [Kitasatospora phosalacinea]